MDSAQDEVDEDIEDNTGPNVDAGKYSLLTVEYQLPTFIYAL